MRRGRIVENILQRQQFVDKSDCGTDAMENATSIRRPNRLSDAMESGATEWALLYVFSSW
jgi:hypothetical protein